MPMNNFAAANGCSCGEGGVVPIDAYNSSRNTYPQRLNCNFLCKGTLAAFDNGVKLIVMRRCIVSLKYGTETGKL